MPNSFTGDPSLNDGASSSSSSSTSPDQNSSHLSPILSPLQEMLNEIKLKLNNPSCTSEEADELYRSLKELRNAANKGYSGWNAPEWLNFLSELRRLMVEAIKLKLNNPSCTRKEADELFLLLEVLRDAANKGYLRWDAPEWLNFLSELSMLMVEAIETGSYNKSILFVLIDLMEGNVPGIDDINKILVPIVSVAAKKGHIEILKRFENAIMDESPEIVSALDCSMEPLRQAILHAQVKATIYLMKHHPLSESIKEIAKAIEKLKTQEKELQTEITLLETENTEFRSRLTALETENTVLRSRLLDESNQPPSRTAYSVFGATSPTTFSSSGAPQSRSSQKRPRSETEAPRLEDKAEGSKDKAPRLMSS